MSKIVIHEKSKTCFIYFRCMSRNEAQKKEAALRNVADTLGLEVANIFFDRRDKLPNVLLKLAEIVCKKNARTILVTDNDWIDRSADYSKALVFYLNTIGFRLITNTVRDENETYLHYIRSAKLYNESITEESLIAADFQQINRLKSTAGRPCFGYSITENGLAADDAGSRIVRRIFELTASGAAPTETVRIVSNEFPESDIPVRSQITQIINNRCYAELDPHNSMDYPPIISPRLFFAAQQAALGRRHADPIETVFLFRKLTSVDGYSYLPMIESKNGKRAVYYSNRMNALLPADETDAVVIDALSSRFIPHLRSLHEKCVQYAHSCSKTAEKRIASISAELCSLQEQKESRFIKADFIPMKKELDSFDEFNSKSKLLSIDLNYQKYLLDLMRNAEKNLSAYFDSLKRLNELNKEEQRYLVNSIIRKATIDGSRMVLSLRGTGGKSISFSVISDAGMNERHIKMS